MENPCANCKIRDKIQAGCCVQGNHPDEAGSKTIVQRSGGLVVRRIEACANLDPITGECSNYYSRPEMCSGFVGCERWV